MAVIAELLRDLKPGFPFVFEVNIDDIRNLKEVAIYKLVSKEEKMYKQINIKWL